MFHFGSIKYIPDSWDEKFGFFNPIKDIPDSYDEKFRFFIQNPNFM